MKIIRYFLYISLFILITAFGQVETDFTPKISRRELAGKVYTLASDEFKGRMPGTSGIKRAEDFIASQYRRTGLKVLPGNDDYFQTFTLYRRGFDYNDTFLKANGRRFMGGTEIAPFSFSGSGETAADTVFAGYGITAPEYGYDDYDGLDVKDKIVFVFRHEPGENDPESPFGGTEHSRHTTFARKAENAYNHGASGLILITDPLHHEKIKLIPTFPPLVPDPDTKISGKNGSPEIDDTFLSIMISEKAAEPFQNEWGALVEPQKKLEQGINPSRMELAAVKTTVKVTRFAEPQPVEARNVLGYLPGEGDRWIVLGAHHDHLGSFDGEGDTIYNGADDNASGTAVVMEAAEHLASLSGKRLTYNILFITFSAEEEGLLGSRHFVESEIVDPEKIDLMINLDMVGRNPHRAVDLSAGAHIPFSREQMITKAESLGLQARIGADPAKVPSDHLPFHKEGIGVISIHTGLHEDYHAIDDHADGIAYTRMELITQLTADLILTVTGE